MNSRKNKSSKKPTNDNKFKIAWIYAWVELSWVLSALCASHRMRSIIEKNKITPNDVWLLGVSRWIMEHGNLYVSDLYRYETPHLIDALAASTRIGNFGVEFYIKIFQDHGLVSAFDKFIRIGFWNESFFYRISSFSMTFFKRDRNLLEKKIGNTTNVFLDKSNK